MRVLVSTTAGSGHFGPLVPFARAFRAEGHDVLVAAPASFATQVAAAGFDHRPFDDAPPELLEAIFGRIASSTFEESNEVVLAMGGCAGAGPALREPPPGGVQARSRSRLHSTTSPMSRSSSSTGRRGR